MQNPSPELARQRANAIRMLAVDGRTVKELVP